MFKTKTTYPIKEDDLTQKERRQLTKKNIEPFPNLTKEKISSSKLEILLTLKMTSHLQENLKEMKIQSRNL